MATAGIDSLGCSRLHESDQLIGKCAGYTCIYVPVAPALSMSARRMAMAEKAIWEAANRVRNHSNELHHKQNGWVPHHIFLPCMHNMQNKSAKNINIHLAANRCQAMQYTPNLQAA